MSRVRHSLSRVILRCLAAAFVAAPLVPAHAEDAMLIE
jgi:hypothetical protein